MKHLSHILICTLFDNNNLLTLDLFFSFRNARVQYVQLLQHESLQKCSLSVCVLKLGSRPAVVPVTCLHSNCHLYDCWPLAGRDEIANLISKLTFYKLIPYPMDNRFTGRHDRSRQTPEKDVLYILPAGPVTECAFARWRIVLPSCLDRVTS